MLTRVVVVVMIRGRQVHPDDSTKRRWEIGSDEGQRNEGVTTKPSQ